MPSFIYDFTLPHIARAAISIMLAILIVLRMDNLFGFEDVRN